MSDPKPVLFLDIDGVLNTERYMVELHEAGKPKYDAFGHLFDPLCVDRLRKIVAGMNGKVDIVISSTWRLNGLEEMQNMWTIRELPGEVHDVTPSISGRVRYESGQGLKDQARGVTVPRGTEIDWWLKTFRSWGFEHYVIFDDDRDMTLMQASKFCHTSWKLGIEDHHVDQALCALKGGRIDHDYGRLVVPWCEWPENKNE